MFLDAPTGSGKSHSVIEFACKRARIDSSFKFFFVTDQKKNLQRDKFRDFWEKGRSNDDDPHDYEKIAVIRSIKDTTNIIKSTFADLEKNFKDNEVELAFKKLKDISDLVEVIDSKDENNGIWKNLKNVEYDFRKALFKRLLFESDGTEGSMLDIECQNKVKRFLANDETGLSNWFYKVYPTIDLERYQIYLCTTDKFIRSYTTFFEKNGKSFLYSKMIEKSLVVFDEVDSTKKKILDKIIDDSLKIEVDLIALFRNIFKGIEIIKNELPDSLKEIITSEDNYKDLVNNSKAINKQFFLSYLYKMKRDPSKYGEDDFLIHASLHTLISDNAKWYSHFSSVKNQVLIDNDRSNDLGFENMLRRTSNFIKSFNRLILKCAIKYVELSNTHREDNENGMDEENAFFTIYRVLGLEDVQIRMLRNIEVDFGNKFNKKSSNELQKFKVEDYREFQKKGITLYYFKDSDKHDLQTEINASIINATPEKFLIALTKKCMVLGLSATSQMPTVLDNYDLEFLKSELGDKFIKDGRRFLTEETLKEFDYHTRYRNQGIKIKVAMVGADNSIESILREYSDIIGNYDQSMVNELNSKLQETLNRISKGDNEKKEGNQDYFRRRYLSLFESFIYFIKDSKITSFLGLQSKLPDNSPEMYRDLIEDVFKILCKQILGPDDDKYPKLCIIAKNNISVPEQIKKSLNLVENGKRIYLLSAYLSIGVGQNLQHKMTSFEKKISKNISMDSNNNSDPRNTEIDLGGIYLGEVTNIITNLRNYKLDTDVLKFVFELEYLLDANEITNYEIKNILNKMEKRRYIKYPRYLQSVVSSLVTRIIQALGRMNRTFNKIENPLVVANYQVINNINYVTPHRERYSPEFQALMSYKGEENNWIQTDNSKLDNANKTAKTSRDNNQLLKGLRNSPRYRLEYNKVREFLLKNPTVNKKELAEAQKEIKRSLQYLSNPYQKTEYKTKCISLNEGDFDFEKDNEANMIISSESSGLDICLKNPKVVQNFKEHNYPLFWGKKDYIINPIQFTLYKGILGEKVGKVLFEDILDEKLEDIEQLENTELFDYKVKNKGIVIDFKNWGNSYSERQDKAREKNTKKLDTLENNTGKSWRVIIINIIAQGENEITTTVSGRIMEIPGLINSKGIVSLASSDVRKVKEFLIES